MEGSAPDSIPADCSALIRPLLADMAATHHGSAYQEIVSRVEESLIRLTMDKYRNNQVHAAKFLGISRNMLRERLKKFQMG
jgi:DNA-binding protein Fis